VRHAWRYRQLFETALKQRRVFERLGRMEKRMNWGRLRAEKWKRSVGNILGLWEGWCVFPQESQEWFASVFNNPPLSAEEEAEEARAREEAAAGKGRSKWKAVEVVAPKEEEEGVAAGDKAAGDEEEDVDGEPMEEDGDVDGEPMEDEDEDVDGVPMEEDVDGEPMQEDDKPPPPASSNPPPSSEEPQAKPPASLVGQPRRRPRAVDMFADSDEED